MNVATEILSVLAWHSLLYHSDKLIFALKIVCVHSFVFRLEWFSSDLILHLTAKIQP